MATRTAANQTPSHIRPVLDASRENSLGHPICWAMLGTKIALRYSVAR